MERSAIPAERRRFRWVFAGFSLRCNPAYGLAEMSNFYCLPGRAGGFPNGLTAINSTGG
jgi:hypothetical protein